MYQLGGYREDSWKGCFKAFLRLDKVAARSLTLSRGGSIVPSPAIYPCTDREYYIRSDDRQP